MDLVASLPASGSSVEEVDLNHPMHIILKWHPDMLQPFCGFGVLLLQWHACMVEGSHGEDHVRRYQRKAAG